MNAISRISTANVERFCSMLSFIEEHTKICLMMEKLAVVAGTKEPIYAMICNMAAPRM
jgi:hypothetical protein